MDKLSFSDLLILGSKQVPRCEGRVFNFDPLHLQVRSACAFGMIAIGMAGTTESKACEEAMQICRRRLREIAPKDCLEAQIADWNDVEGLTTERIAAKLKKKGL
jgi:hypothetical protein